MSNSLDSNELLLRGKTAAYVGRRDEARALLRRAVEVAPDNLQAWLALAGVEDEPVGKMRCFEMALKLDPDNTEAHMGLEALRTSLSGRGAPDAQALASPAPGAEPLTPPAGEDELEAVIAQASRQLEATSSPARAGQGPRAPAGVGVTPPLQEEVLYCANHPSVETRLRCNRCGKPICTRCAVRTPVGYRCKECMGRQQATFYTGGVGDYVIGAVIALVMGALASLLMGQLAFWLFALILGPAIGIGIAELVRLAVQRRRSRYLWLASSAGLIAGAMPALFFGLLRLNFFGLLTVGLFLALAAASVAARLR